MVWVYNTCASARQVGLISRVLTYLSTFDLRSIIDIVVVTFVVYKLLMLIKGTKAVQLLKGLAVLVIVSTLSERFHLYTMSWLVEKVWTALFVALPVVFQPELRRALEQLGRGGFFGRHSLTTEEEIKRAVSQVVRAVEICSKRHVGALIVFARTTGLQEYVETGTKMDSLVTGELLVNIFEPNTPLHDGAVVIHGNRILAAACYLPLTESAFLNKEFGTRHRAAIGITEQSDAVALVISEETGTVSLVQSGEIVRGLNGPVLQRRLEEILANNGKGAGGKNKK
jgi:diadenylate cyclase